MTATAPTRRPAPQGWPLVAWVVDPAIEPRQFTHAVLPGHTVAMCGLVTTVTGGPWPDPHEPWLLPRMRCGRCARAVQYDGLR